ncbi:hypothetical protein DFQ28_009600 [Apophysomyces sp. BC1034]|nr:hypothetical protein DFQ30_006558 [Apophysomyces sp. BC1015]KAG0181037.1 hypothetical protein DFQ29_009504 [Apophysomyces sp. BC1021]KAG0192279.1 hypothetical protein DFQ28_009600 [Apophysomyces sp. BC1034]
MAQPDKEQIEFGTCESHINDEQTKEKVEWKDPPDGGRAWLGLFCTQGYGYTLGIFLRYYNTTMYLDRMTELSWVVSIWLALSNIIGPFYGFFAAKVGYKWMLCGAVVFNTAAMMLASVAHEIWHLYLTQGVLAGIGASLVWFPCISAAQQWFSKRRGLSVGLAISGSGFGGLVFSNVIQAAIDSLGIQWALRIVGFISLVLLSIAAATVRPLNVASTKNLKAFNLAPFRNKQFVLLFIIQLIGNFAFNIPSGFLASYARHIGLGEWVGTNLSAILAGVMIVGKISTGFIGDYIGRANMNFICITMTGILCLAVWLPATTAAQVWVFAALFGYFGGGYMTSVPAVLAQVVGLEDIEASNGLLFFGWFFGGLFGSPISSALINADGKEETYSYAIIFGGVLMIVAGLLAWAVRVMQGGWSPLKKL